MLTSRTEDGAFDLDAEDDLDADLDAPAPEPRSAPGGPPAGRRRAVVVVLAGAVALALLVGAGSVLLRSPQERLEGRLTSALDAAGVELAEPVSLEPTGDEGGLWWGRVRVRDEQGATSGTRVVLRLDDGSGTTTEGLFPRVDCDSRYPLAYTGDSENSYRTTSRDLSECSSQARGDGVLVTVSWNGRDAGDDGGRGRQTWLTDGDGGLVWLQNGPGRSSGPAQGSLTGEQQRAVATAEGLLTPL